MISIFYGTRPEYIKLINLYNILKVDRSVELVKVNQHTTLISDCVFDREINIESKLNRLDSIIASCMNNIFSVDTELVIVQGDTATAFGVALSSFHKKIPVAHIESGLRTYDIKNPYPEEFYRRSISIISSYNFCVSNFGLNNLNSEQVSGENIIVGNTVIDSLFKNNDIEYQNDIIVTLHRRENKNIIHEWLMEINNIAINNKDLNIIFIKHPSIDIKEDMYPYISFSNSLNRYILIEKIKKCKFIITDSGGIQEESSFFNKKSIVCRKATERVEGLEYFSKICSSPKNLHTVFKEMNENFKINLQCPYGDGKSSEKIAKYINENIQRRDKTIS